MDASKDNANPTIINPFDLPSRKSDLPSASLPRRGRLFESTLLGDSSSDENSDNEVEVEPSHDDLSSREEIDAQEIYDLIAPITDPEHPLSLGSLGVVNLADIFITPPSSANSRISSVTVLVTPTTSACSLTTVIGLGVRVRLMNALPPRFRIDVRIKEGTSASADEANKQLGDKERVAAAMENRNLISLVGTMLSSCV